MIFHILTPLYTAFSTHFWYREGLPYFVSVDSFRMKSHWNSSHGKCFGACCLKLSTIWLIVCYFPHCLIQNSVTPLINDFVSSTVGALFHTTSIIIFFHKPRNYCLIHRKIFQPIYKCIWFFTSYIYKSIACLLCFYDSFCRLPFTVHSDKNEEFIQMGTKNCVQGVIMPHLNWPKQHCCKKKIGNVEFHL